MLSRVAGALGRRGRIDSTKVSPFYGTVVRGSMPRVIAGKT